MTSEELATKNKQAVHLLHARIDLECIIFSIAKIRIAICYAYVFNGCDKSASALPRADAMAMISERNAMHL